MIRTFNAFRLFVLTLLASLALGAQAQLSIETHRYRGLRFPVIIPIFEYEGRLPQTCHRRGARRPSSAAACRH